MPYIDATSREWLQHTNLPHTAGELTYVLYTACLRFLPGKPCFGDFASILGALEATKLEIYRRRIAPYEDAKLAENGDVT